jgi:hypothetical protein
MIIRSIEDILNSLLNEQDKKYIKYIYGINYINNNIYEYKNSNYKVSKIFSILNVTICEFASKVLNKKMVYNTNSPIQLWTNLITYLNNTNNNLDKPFLKLKKLRNLFIHSDKMFHNNFNYISVFINVYKIIVHLISNNLYEYVINFVIAYKKLAKLLYQHLLKTSIQNLSAINDIKLTANINELINDNKIHANYYRIIFKDMNCIYNICHNTGSIIYSNEGKYKNELLQVVNISHDFIECVFYNNRLKKVILPDNCNITITNKMIKF